MKYIVTGGAGFIGSNLVDLLIKEEHEVCVIDNFSSGKKENCNNKAKYYELDISDTKNYNEIKKIIKGSNGVFHLAALPRVQESIENPIDFEKNNTLSTINILKACHDSKVKRLIYSASSSAYGNAIKLPMKETDSVDPISPYAMQKYYGEVACKMFSKVYNVETVSLRYFNVYGERQSLEGAYALVMCVFAKQRLDKKPLTVRGDGEQRRDFTHVVDIVDGLYKVGMGNEKHEDAWELGCGTNYSINEVYGMFLEKYPQIESVYLPDQAGNYRKTLRENDDTLERLGWKPQDRLRDYIQSL